MVHHGDWIVAKAAGCATIRIDGLGLVDFWVTHVRVETGRILEITAADDLSPRIRLWQQEERTAQSTKGLIA
jgi:hypothetical protein